MASGPGISGNLEKSGNFVALAKSQGISWNSDMLGNFNANLWKVREFYLHESNIAEDFSRFIEVGEQELVASGHNACSWMFI